MCSGGALTLWERQILISPRPLLAALSLERFGRILLAVMEAYMGETRAVVQCFLDHHITFSECLFAMEEALVRLERRELLRHVQTNAVDPPDRKPNAHVYKRSASAAAG